jgi:hypothetical protein
LLVVLLASISAALLIPHVNAHDWSLLEGLSIVAIVILALIPAIHSWANKTFELFEPVHMVAFATIISFALAPVLLIGRGQIAIGGVSFRDKLLEAIVLAGLALLGFYLGYYLVRQHFHNGRKIGASEYTVTPPVQNQIHKWATIALLISFVIYLIWLELTNLPLSALNSLSESSHYGLAFSLAETNYVFLFQIRTAWIALLLLAYPARSRKRKHKLAVCILWLAVALIFTLSGSRGIMFELLIATAIYFYLLKNRRPRIHTVLIAALVLLIAMGSIVILRSKNRLKLTTGALSGEVQREITDSGAATGMMVLLTVFPDMNEFINIQLFEELLIAPIPRALWPEKPRLRGVQNIAEQFVPRSHAPPFFGPYYAAFGYAGSILSLAIFGAASGWVYSLWKRQQGSILRAVLLAVWIALLWDLYHRGGLIWSTVKVVYAMGPILVIAWLAKRHNQRNSDKTSNATKRTTI